MLSRTSLSRTSSLARSRTRRITIVLLALALAAAACGGDDKKPEASDGSSSSGADTTTAPTPPPPPPVHPLTGMPVTDPATLGRPALIVKFDNVDGSSRKDQSRPQAGINQADVVFEELVEGNITRLAAVYHSTNADAVGPVRSARTTDISIFSAFNGPIFAYSGANQIVLSALADAPMFSVSQDGNGELFERRGDRIGPHNVFTSTQTLYGSAPPELLAPPVLFAYRGAGEPLPATAAPVGSIHLTFGEGFASAPVDWAWRPDLGGFGRDQKGTPHLDEAGTQVAPQNVVVQFVDYIDSGQVDIVGTPVPEGVLVGSGSCWVLTNGALIQGTWTKAAPEAVTQYLDAAGAPIKLTPGRTWVELVPPGGGVVTG